jgi:hypothetical protein
MGGKFGSRRRRPMIFDATNVAANIAALANFRRRRLEKHVAPLGRFAVPLTAGDRTLSRSDLDKKGLWSFCRFWKFR